MITATKQTDHVPSLIYFWLVSGLEAVLDIDIFSRVEAKNTGRAYIAVPA